MLHLTFTSRPFDKISTDCAVIPAFSNWRPLKGNAALLDWRLNGRLSEILIRNRFAGTYGEGMLMPAEGRVRSREILVMGMGESQDFTESSVNEFAPMILDKLNKLKAKDFLLSLSDLITDRFAWRNSVRLMISKLHDYSDIQAVRFCETEEMIRDARKRFDDFGMNIDVSFE